MTSRRLISSGGPWEARGGYSRAIVVGDSCYVAGTTDAGPDGQDRVSISFALPVMSCRISTSVMP